MIKIGSVYYMDNHFSSYKNVVTVPVKNLEMIKDLDLIILWGGEDISPSFYNEVPKYTHASVRPSPRDVVEATVFKAALDNKVPVLGVCRGAQFMCCLLGGKLWQDVNNHAGRAHDVMLADGRTIVTNSLHHQMMRPKEGDGHQLLGWSDGISTYRRSQTEFEVAAEKEPEIVLWPGIGLAVQGHPEYQDIKSPLNKITQEFLTTYFALEMK